MKNYIEILFKNDKIERYRIDNPNEKFELKVKVDGKESKTHYFYRRDKSYERKGLFFKHRVCFYEYGNPEPLDAKFNTPSVDMKDIQKLIESNIIEQLGASVKNKDLGMTTGAIIAVTAIIALVVIVLVG